MLSESQKAECRQYHLVPEYSDLIGKVFYSMKVGEVFPAEKYVKPENKEKFISTVKMFMDFRMGWSEGWALSPNGDFSKIKKVER